MSLKKISVGDITILIDTYLSKNELSPIIPHLKEICSREDLHILGKLFSFEITNFGDKFNCASKREKIIINFGNLDLSDAKSIELFNTAIVHEIGHVFHDKLNPVAQLIFKSNTRLVAIWEAILQKDVKTYKMLRELLYTAFHLIFAEGFARFFEKYFEKLKDNKDFILSNQYMDWGLENAIQGGKDFKRIIDDILIQKEIPNDYEPHHLAFYQLGFHMVQAIIKIKRKTFEEVAKMPIKKFFLSYEDSMHTIGEKPLISFVSGAGVYFDYKKVLDEIKQKMK